MGWSAQDLADRCEQLGHSIPRNVIANMESGRRANLPLVDVMVLAAALETYPVCLIFPVGYVERTQELPFQHLIPTWDALRHFTGEQEVPMYDAGLVPDFEHHASLVQTALAALEEEEHARSRPRPPPAAPSRKKPSASGPSTPTRPSPPSTTSATSAANSARTAPPHPICHPHWAMSTHPKKNPTPPRRNAFERLHLPPLLLP